MKKLFLLIFFFFFLTAVCSAAPQWIFDDSETVDMWQYSGTDYQLSNGILLLNPTGHDPVMETELSSDEEQQSIWII